MAALRFAVQPLDDLSLANLLVSPLFGWSQEELLDHGYRPEGRRLWDHLRAVERSAACARWRECCAICCARADYEPPQALLHWMLAGPWHGRRKLVARLGREANDPIDELLNAALAYAGSAYAEPARLHPMVRCGRGRAEARGGARRGLVRVMTVHGSKGLQAPDRHPGRCDRQSRRVAGARAGAGRDLPGGTGARCRCPPLRKEEKVGRIAAAEAERRGRRAAGTLAAALCRDDPRRRGAVHRRRAGHARRSAGAG